MPLMENKPRSIMSIILMTGTMTYRIKMNELR